MEGEYECLGLRPLLIDREAHVMAWANRKGAFYTFSLLAQVAGVKTTARLLRQRLEKLNSSLGAFDVVHITSFCLFGDVFVWGLLRCKGSFIVLHTLHDPVFRDEASQRRTRRIYRRVLRNCWKFAVDEPRYWLHIHNPRLLEGFSVPTGAKVMFHEHPLPRPRVQRKRTADGRLWVGFLGRIEPYKGVDTLIAAMLRLQEMWPELVSKIKLIIVGGGRFDATRLNLLKMEAQVENRHVSDLEFHQWMAEIDLLVLPYLAASQSGVGTMGMAYQRRIVATAVGGMGRLWSRYPQVQIVAPGDECILAEAIAKEVRIGP
jgi:glycosyltransferase involved in cell wall biosynthesis